MTVVPPVPESARCRNCRSADLLVWDGPDGPIVCLPCINMLGGLANDPSQGTNRTLTALEERHGDVVRLNRKHAELRWEWTRSGWPGAETS